jgi:hypothetical protein
MANDPNADYLTLFCMQLFCLFCLVCQIDLVVLTEVFLSLSVLHIIESPLTLKGPNSPAAADSREYSTQAMLSL